MAGAKKLAEVMELQGALAQAARHPDGSSRGGANTAKMKGRFGFHRGGDKHEPPTAAYAQVYVKSSTLKSGSRSCNFSAPDD